MNLSHLIYIYIYFKSCLSSLSYELVSSHLISSEPPPILSVYIIEYFDPGVVPSGAPSILQFPEFARSMLTGAVGSEEAEEGTQRLLTDLRDRARGRPIGSKCFKV